MIKIYTDGACKGNPGVGGWGAIIMQDEKNIELFGGENETTNKSSFDNVSQGRVRPVNRKTLGTYLHRASKLKV